MLSNLVSIASLAALALAQPHGVARRDAHRSLAKRFTGVATWYIAYGTGHCGNKLTGEDNIVALNSQQFNMGVCGKSITISYGGTTAQGVIVDSCPGCQFGYIDLSQALFQKFAGLDKGVFDVTWSFNDGSGGGSNSNKDDDKDKDKPKTTTPPPAPKTTTTPKADPTPEPKTTSRTPVAEKPTTTSSKAQPTTSSTTSSQTPTTTSTTEESSSSSTSSSIESSSLPISASLNATLSANSTTSVSSIASSSAPSTSSQVTVGKAGDSGNLQHMAGFVIQAAGLIVKAGRS